MTIWRARTQPAAVFDRLHDRGPALRTLLLAERREMLHACYAAAGASPAIGRHDSEQLRQISAQRCMTGSSLNLAQTSAHR
jgi:ATP-dependent DNA ligase